MLKDLIALVYCSCGYVESPREVDICAYMSYIALSFELRSYLPHPLKHPWDLAQMCPLFLLSNRQDRKEAAKGDLAERVASK